MAADLLVSCFSVCIQGFEIIRFFFFRCFETLELLPDLKMQYTFGRLWLEHKFVLYLNRYSEASTDHNII